MPSVVYYICFRKFCIRSYFSFAFCQSSVPIVYAPSPALLLKSLLLFTTMLLSDFLIIEFPIEVKVKFYLLPANVYLGV